MTDQNLLVTVNFLFFIGLVGFILNRKNIIFAMITTELMLLGVNLNFLVTAIILNDILGIIISFLILGVASVELAIGLSLTILYFTLKYSIKLYLLTDFRG